MAKVGRVLLGFVYVLIVGFLAAVVLGALLPADSALEQGWGRSVVFLVCYPVAWVGWQTKARWYVKGPALFLLTLIPVVNWVVLYWTGNGLLQVFRRSAEAPRMLPEGSRRPPEGPGEQLVGVNGPTGSSAATVAAPRRSPALWAFPLLVFLVLLWYAAAHSPTNQQPPGKATPTAEPEPTGGPVASAPVQPPGWMYWDGKDMGFSAFIPDGWEAEPSPTRSGESARSITFSPAAAVPSQDMIVFHVTADSAEGLMPPGAPKRAALRTIGEKVIASSGVTMVAEPADIDVLGLPGVLFSYDERYKSADIVIRNNAVVFSAGEWLYLVKVAGLPEHSDDIQQAFGAFLAGFRTPPVTNYDASATQLQTWLREMAAERSAAGALGLSLMERLRLGTALSSRLTGSEKDDDATFVKVAQRAAQAQPMEWVLAYMLCDRMRSLGDYAGALPVCQRTVELRPNDFRSAYALAEEYNLLVSASFTDAEVRAYNEWVKQHPGGPGMPIDMAAERARAQSALDALHMTVPQAATEAIRYFTESIRLSPSEEVRTQVQEDLNAMLERFPQR